MPATAIENPILISLYLKPTCRSPAALNPKQTKYSERNWETADQVVAFRYRANGYRLFRREDLNGLLRQVAQTSGESSKD
jgi:hypothetical protein